MISQFRSFFHDRIVATTTRDYLEYFIAATIAVALFLSTAMSDQLLISHSAHWTLTHVFIYLLYKILFFVLNLKLDIFDCLFIFLHH